MKLRTVVFIWLVFIAVIQLGAYMPSGFIPLMDVVIITGFLYLPQWYAAWKFKREHRSAIREFKKELNRVP